MPTPIIDMLNGYAKSHPLRLHMPGHKGQSTFTDLTALDVTELPMSDDLSSPSGVIAQSQNLFAGLYGAKHAKYLVNGSSVALLAMVACSKGELLITRSCHKSVYNGLKIFNKTAIILNDLDTFGLTKPLSVDYLVNYLKEHKSIGTLLITSPDYYGNCYELDKLYSYCVFAGVLLFVDGAHGAHHGLSHLLPPCAVNSCSAVVVSAHKTLPALTQTSALLSNDKALFGRLCEVVNMLTSTSPSYLLLASLDYAQDYCRQFAEAKFDELFQEVIRFDNALPNGITRRASDDFTRVVLDVGGLNISGKRAYDFLAERNVFCEFAIGKYLVIILTMVDDKPVIDRLICALNDLLQAKLPQVGVTLPEFQFDNSVRVCFNFTCEGHTELVPLEESVGRVSAEIIGVTPPCSPVVLCGEKISSRAVELLKEGDTFGLYDGLVKVRSNL